MKRWRTAVLLLFILASGLWFRWTGLNWDDYQHHHPDERYISWVATTIERPSNWRTAFIPDESSFNPYYWPPDAASKGIVVAQDEPRKFAYGHLPLYLGVTATRAAEWVGDRIKLPVMQNWPLVRDVLQGNELIEYRRLTAVARALTGLVDVGTVLIVFLLARELMGTTVGLVSAAFLSLNVMHIQLAHFFTVDPYLTFFVTAALYLMVLSVKEVRFGRQAKRWWLLLAGICVGLAVGSKFAAILLFLPLALTIWVGFRERWLAWLVTAVMASFLAFAVTNPFALLDFSCKVVTPAITMGPVEIPSIDWRACFLDNIGAQGEMVRGKSDVPFTRQYAGTRPFIYFFEMQFRWGMGPLLAILAFAGFGWVVWRVSRPFFPLSTRPSLASSAPILITLAWTVPYFLTTGSFFVKFMRYLQPLTPFLMIFAAGLLWQIKQLKWRWGVTAVVLGSTAFFALSFVNLYKTPHPWNTASEWIYRHVEPGSLILSEQWDDSLPFSIVIDGKKHRRTEYQEEPLTWLSGTGNSDDETKLSENLALLARADYLTIMSNRVYGVVPRQPERYPISSQYHQLLFDGSLGYDVVFVNGRFPHLGRLNLKPDLFTWAGLQPPEKVASYLSQIPGITVGRADESFTVYDQPLTMVFQNTAKLTAAEMEALFH